MEAFFTPLYTLIQTHESWLMERILYYAKLHGYTMYTSTLLEAWRVSICGLSAPILAALQEFPTIEPLEPGFDYQNDPIAAFGVMEAQRHRSRGVTIELFLGLLKYYRQAYLDLVALEGSFTPAQRIEFQLLLHRCFDRIELGLCHEWITLGETEKIEELQAENRVMVNEKNRYLTLFESFQNPAFLLDLNYQILNLNQAAALTFTQYNTAGGFYYDLEAGKTLELPWLRAIAMEFEAHHQPQEVLERRLATNAGDRWFDLRVQHMLDVSSKFTGIVVICTDIESRKQNELKLRQLSQACEQSPAAIVITDVNGCIEYVNPKFEQVTGYSLREIQGQNPRLLKSGHTAAEVYCNLWQTLKSGQIWRGELHNRRKNGELFWEYASISPMKNEQGEVTHFMAVKEDITQRKQAEALLNYQANYDALTALPNRTFILQLLRQALLQSQYDHKTLAVLCLDLDHFKTINETLGHSFGDQLLVAVAKRIRDCLESEDLLGRLGGDEFLVILPQVRHPSQVTDMAQNLITALEAPFSLPSHDGEWFLSTSIGISLAPENGQQVNTLLRNADTALYRAKNSGRNTWAYFRAHMTEVAQRRQTISQHLRHALGRDEMFLMYQPIVNLQTGQTAGGEALLRWHNPVLGRVPPDEFIEVAEETNLILKLGQWVLEQVVPEVRRWQRPGVPPFWVAVNLSPRQFHSTAMLAHLQQLLHDNELNPACLELEITERLLMDDVPEAVDLLHQLNHLGFLLSLDDFGTGYSSLSYCKRFPFTTLKIDKSFILDLPGDLESAALTRAIVAMAHELGLTVVAEGVETQAQLDFLRQEGCDYGQGFYFAPALAAEEFRRYCELSWTSPTGFIRNWVT